MDPWDHLAKALTCLAASEQREVHGALVGPKFLVKGIYKRACGPPSEGSSLLLYEGQLDAVLSPRCRGRKLLLFGCGELCGSLDLRSIPCGNFPLW
jgi:hypothetical protein